MVIDCDTGIDDALALIYLAGLHHAGEIELVGVSTTAGNVDVRQTAINSHFVLARCGLADVPVAPGSPVPLAVELVTTPETHGPKGLGYVLPEDHLPAAWPWQEIWDQAQELIVTGPATNLALYTRGHAPARITLMGGAYLYPGNTTPTAEWNSWVDPHAAKEVFELETPITVCSLGVTEQFTLNPDSLALLVAELGDTPVAGILDDALRFYFEFHEQQGEGYLAQIHDLLTCMIALGTVDYEATETGIDVEADSPLMRGTTVADFRGHWDRPKHRLVSSVDIPGAHKELRRAAGLLASHFRVG